MAMLKSIAPVLFYEEEQTTMAEFFMEKIFQTIPVYGYITNTEEYTTQMESDISYETIIAREAADENYVDEETGEVVIQEDAHLTEIEQVENKEETEQAAEVENTDGEIVDEPDKNETKPAETEVAGSTFVPRTEKVVTFPQEKLLDFDYLIQNFYLVDRTTTIDSSRLNAADLLSRSMKLTHTPDAPQILIYHTHSQEGFVDSVPGDASTTIVGVGAYLHKLLGTYGFHVLHHTGEYDVDSRDDAYSKAGPALEQILRENPSIEVVIDLHRDGVAEGTHLVTEVDGKQMASIMFFNGLSRTTANGDIGYLPNPYIQDNLAFSLQMQLAAEEYYPDFSRMIYLKGYRYNMHYCPKTLLVEVGAQTNTLQEAMNAMEPLADIIAKVISP
ncbi:MAG: stage II sporulation protein P [Lachnospiraceae bacterium]|nr:stage II sporulation protein P [Lachnospiraceae bacterium]